MLHVDDDGDGAKPNTQYIALFNNIIHRWRFPKFLTIVSQKHDKQVKFSIFTNVMKLRSKLCLFDAFAGFISPSKNRKLIEGKRHIAKASIK